MSRRLSRAEKAQVIQDILAWADTDDVVDPLLVGRALALLQSHPTRKQREVVDLFLGRPVRRPWWKVWERDA